MEQAPIKFEYKGKTYKGYFSQVSGAASTGHFHLMIDNFFYGQLFYTNKWEFHSQDHLFEDLSDFFGDYITAWYE